MDLCWKESIVVILKQVDCPLHYKDIADMIFKKGLRVNVGNTPSNSVNNTICRSINKDGKKSPFIRVGDGYYTISEKHKAVLNFHIR